MIHVTEDHIANGKDTITDNPIALAIKEDFEPFINEMVREAGQGVDLAIEVTRDSALIGEMCYWLPIDARVFLEAWRNKEKVKPISIDLDACERSKRADWHSDNY